MLFNNLNINSLVGNISNTLNIINRIIPLYSEISPIFKNGKKLISTINNYKNTSVIKTKNIVDNNIKPKINTTINNPTFFL